MRRRRLNHAWATWSRRGAGFVRGVERVDGPDPVNLRNGHHWQQGPKNSSKNNVIASTARLASTLVSSAHASALPAHTPTTANDPQHRR